MAIKSPAAIERRKAKAREKYRQNKIKLYLQISGQYRGPRENGELESDGRDARCDKCGRLLRVDDFDTDVTTGLLIEASLCRRCRC